MLGPLKPKTQCGPLTIEDFNCDDLELCEKGGDCGLQYMALLLNDESMGLCPYHILYPDRHNVHLKRSIVSLYLQTLERRLQFKLQNPSCIVRNIVSFMQVR